MILWNRKRRIFLITGSLIWIIFIIGTSIYLHPKKRSELKLEKQEWVDLLRKNDKTHEENIAVLNILRKGNTFQLDKNEIKKIIRETTDSLSSSIIPHQIKYNQSKQNSLELFFQGLGIMFSTWGLIYILSRKPN